jgi:hypothetical protein
MEYPRLKVNASHATTIHKYKKLKTKIMKFNANICFNNKCLDHRVIPAFARLKVPHNLPASHITQRKAQILHVKDEI